MLKMPNKEHLFKWGKILLLYAPFIIALVIIKTKSGHYGDVSCWKNWTEFGFTDGFSNIYKSGTDYLPLYHYMLFFYGKIQGSVEAIVENIYKLKILTLLFEFGITLMLFKILNNKFKDLYKSLFLSLFYFLNIGVLYNSLIWGQVDGILTFFVFGAAIFAYKKKIFLSLLFFVLALNMKLQAIVFFPVIGLLLFPVLLDKSQIKKWLYAAIGIGAIQLLIILPFILAGDFAKLWNVIIGSVGMYPKVSMNAYNMWYFFIDEPMQTSDSNMFLGVTYNKWGLFLFFLTSFFALLHFLKSLIFSFLKKVKIEYSSQKTLISFCLIPLLFFFFNTQMHERYSHPALIFLATYAMLYNKPLPYILGSVAYFLNMEDVLQFFQTHNYHTLVYTPWFIAIIYLLTIILLFADLYGINFKRKKYENRPVHNRSHI
jgi:Gpi18-like mannosyltransferase